MDLKNLDPEKAFLGVGWSFRRDLKLRARRFWFRMKRTSANQS